MKNAAALMYTVLILVLPVSMAAQANGTEKANLNSQVTSNVSAPVSGTGVPNFAPLWITPTQLGSSVIYQSGTRVSIGSTTPAAQLTIRATELIPGFSSRGADAGGGSDQNGTNGANLFGGSADQDSGVASGGAGVFGVGGLSSQLRVSAGPGGLFVGGVSPGGSGGPGIGVQAICYGSGCVAGQFTGNVQVTGALSAAVKNFKIDHPLDPANKYLVHASVESSEMKTIYDGTVVLDQNGKSLVQLPDWFEALNGNFRYQLTAIGTSSPGLYIAQKIAGNRFQIAGGSPRSEVSWQVTGVRQDPFAQANPLNVEQVKSDTERGSYLHPELYGQGEDKGFDWARRSQLLRQAQDPSARQ